MTPEEIAWVAGLLEGEGSFVLGARGNRVDKPKIQQIQITCGMTDRDVMLKLHQVVGIGNTYLERRRDPRRSNVKQMYIWNASKRADVVPFLKLIRPHMGDRRGAKIDELLQYAEDNPLIYNQPVVCGTRRAYRKGCRCDRCRRAASDYARDLRERKRNGSFYKNQD